VTTWELADGPEYFPGAAFRDADDHQARDTSKHAAGNGAEPKRILNAVAEPYPATAARNTATAMASRLLSLAHPCVLSKAAIVAGSKNRQKLTPQMPTREVTCNNGKKSIWV
jgi:hypothetical protein